MGKSSRLQFFSSHSHVPHSLNRIHCDHWGPFPIVLNQGFRYYAIFLDEHSRFFVFYPVKYKSDFLNIFVAFKNLVENQFTTKIKEFQSYEGVEFTSKQLKLYL